MKEKQVMEENPLGTQPIGKLLRGFAIPSCISLIVNALYNIIDQIFIGRGVGYLGNGATNVILPFTILAIAISVLFGDGCAAFFSMQLGKGEKEQAARGVGNAVFCSVIAGIILCVVCSIFLHPLCRLTGATDTLMPYSLEYGRVIMLGLPFCVFECGMGSIIRADGSPKYSMVGLLAGCGTNIVLDYLFVFPLHMGVAGAAIATVCGQVVNAVIFVLYFFRFRSVKLRRVHWKLNPSYIGKICKLGISSFVTQISVVAIIIITNRLLVYYGASSKYGAEIPLTALGVTMKINNILVSIMVGIAAGALPIIGYNYGAMKYERVKKAVQLSIGSAMLCGFIATICFQVFPEQIVSIFGTSSDLYMEFGVKCLRLFLMFCILDGMNNVVPTVFQAVGRPGASAASSLLRQIGFNVPPALICPLFVGVTGVLWNGPIACAAAFILNVILLKRVFHNLKKEMHYV